MTDRTEAHKRVCYELNKIYDQKNRDYRAALTEDLNQRFDLAWMPISWSNFAGTSECKRKDGDGDGE